MVIVPIRMPRLILLSSLFVFSTASNWAGNPPVEEKSPDASKEALTLKATRTLEFETQEGTWISLDVSPDGTFVVFDLLGDLLKVPMDGGKAESITEGPAFDSQPAISPDGQWIAYVSDKSGGDNLWICKTDGSAAKALTKGKRDSYLSPTWTPDSRYVVVGKGERGVELWMYHVDGGSGISLKSANGEGDDGPSNQSTVLLGPEVSPDGRYLYYSKKAAKSVYNQMTFDWNIFRRDMVSGDEDQVTQADFGAFRPLLSPDGSLLVYGTRHDAQTGLRIRNLHSGEDRWLKYPVQRDDMESRASRDLLPGYSFTPDGKEIVFTTEGKIWRINVDTGNEAEVPFSAQVSRGIGPLLNTQRKVAEGPVRSRLIRFPTQSPNGDAVVFSAMANIYTMSLPDRKIARVTSSDDWEFKPSWSPDGKWIVYVTWDYAGKGHIWKMAADGSSAPQRLTTDPAFYTDPTFSPDGSRIVARRGNSWMRSQAPSEFGGMRIPLDLIWLPAQGGATSLIVPARGLGAPHFGPEQDRVYFHSSDGLVSMRFDGTDRRTHVQILGKKQPGAKKASTADEIQVDPSGKWAVAKVSNQLYLLPVPAIGGDGASINVFSPEVPVSRITDIGADSFAWADSGKTISWGVGSTYFRRALSSVSFDELKQKDKAGASEDSPESKGEGSTAEAAGGDQNQPATKPAREENASVESFEAVIEFPRHTPVETILLRGATAITMDGEEVIPNADLLVKGNRIAAIGRRGTLEVPESAQVLNLEGKFILPGFVDTHAHYEMRTEGVLELHNWSFASNVAYGVTTGLDVQTSTNDYLTYQDLVEAGMMIGPRAYSTGPGVFSQTDFQTAEEAYWVLKKYKEYYRNDNLKAYLSGNRQQRQWVAQAANRLGLTVTTEGGLDLKLDLTHALDGFGGNEHALPIIPLAKDVVQLFAQSRTAYTPTLLVLYGGPFAESFFYQTTEVHGDAKINRFVHHNDLDLKSRRQPWFYADEHAFPKVAAEAGKVQRAGGLIGVGGHGQLQGLGYHWEMWALAMGGLTPQEVLKAATIDGAHIIGLEQDLGSLKVGKLADLLILEKNPLENIRHSTAIGMVMKNGEIFDAETLNQTWPVKKEFAPFWWWNDLPTTKEGLSTSN